MCALEQLSVSDVTYLLTTLLLLLCRAFFEAGMAWNAAGRHSMAFVILNRFLDLADAQEDPGVHSLAELENADFASTGTFSFNSPSTLTQRSLAFCTYNHVYTIWVCTSQCTVCLDRRCRMIRT